jgi:hypothetical protein
LRAHLGPFLRDPGHVLPGHNGLSNVRLPPHRCKNDNVCADQDWFLVSDRSRT